MKKSKDDMMCGNSTGECVPKPSSEAIIKFTNVNKKDVKRACQIDETITIDDSQCSNNATACKNFNDQVVCCMYANGVCCGKNGLCCPNGYTCDQTNESCQLNDDNDEN